MSKTDSVRPLSRQRVVEAVRAGAQTIRALQAVFPSASAHNLTQLLSEAASRGEVVRLARGLYGAPGARSPEVPIEEIVLQRLGLKAAARPHEPRVRWRLGRRCAPKAPGVPLLLLSDLHYGEVVQPEAVFHSNTYNPDICRARLEHVVRTATMLLKQHLAHPSYPGIVVALAGDMISGSIHEELADTDACPPLVQAREVAVLLADAIAFLAQEFSEVWVYGVPGNHGRTTRRPRTKSYAHYSLDWVAYQFLADWLSGSRWRERVHCSFPAARDLTFTVEGRTFRLTHGDQFRGGDSLIGPLGPVLRGDARKRVTDSLMPGRPEQYDTLLVGHWHQLWLSHRVIVNGSLKGYDEYALQIGAPWEAPAQALVTVHPHHGLTWLMPIYCHGNPDKNRVK